MRLLEREFPVHSRQLLHRGIGYGWWVATLVGKGLFRLARALRVASSFIAGITALFLVASPFVASSFTNWLTTVGVTVGALLGVYLVFYLGIPNLLARFAMAILPEDQMSYAFTELAIWDYENRQGSAHRSIRRQL